MVVLYLLLHFTLVSKEYTRMLSTTPEYEFMSTRKQCTNPNVNENTFQTIPTNSFVAEPTPTSLQDPKQKRKAPAIHEETAPIPPRRVHQFQS